MKDSLTRFYYLIRHKIACFLHPKNDVRRVSMSTGLKILFVNECYIQFEDKGYVLRDKFFEMSLEEAEKLGKELRH